MTKTIWLHVVFAEERVSMPGHSKARSLGRQPSGGRLTQDPCAPEDAGNIEGTETELCLRLLPVGVM